IPSAFVTDQVTCLHCKKHFSISFLRTHFNHPLCDQCRHTGNSNDNFNDKGNDLITMTNAKNEYCLDHNQLRDIPHIRRPNPHDRRYVDMHLFLRSQVEQCAINKFGSLEKLHELQQDKQNNRIARQQKGLEKRMKILRRIVKRNRLDKESVAVHVHKWITTNECNEMVIQKCDECGAEREIEEL
ncbi:hypothetical protein GJ496_002213, partial [Pomphorhynchus laevis]